MNIYGHIIIIALKNSLAFRVLISISIPRSHEQLASFFSSIVIDLQLASYLLTYLLTYVPIYIWKHAIELPKYIYISGILNQVYCTCNNMGSNVGVVIQALDILTIASRYLLYMLIMRQQVPRQYTWYVHVGLWGNFHIYLFCNYNMQ